METEETKSFVSCKEALDFLEKLHKKKLSGNLHSKLHEDNTADWRVTWKQKLKKSKNNT